MKLVFPQFLQFEHVFTGFTLTAQFRSAMAYFQMKSNVCWTFWDESQLLNLFTSKFWHLLPIVHSIAKLLSLYLIFVYLYTNCLLLFTKSTYVIILYLKTNSWAWLDLWTTYTICLYFCFYGMFHKKDQWIILQILVWWFFGQK